VFYNLGTFIETFIIKAVHEGANFQANLQAIDVGLFRQAIDSRTILQADVRCRSELHLHGILQPPHLRLFRHHQGKRRERGQVRVQEYVRWGQFQQSGHFLHHGEWSRVPW
jgi:hypothetical protein